MQSLVPRGELESGPQDPELKSLMEKYQTLQNGAAQAVLGGDMRRGGPSACPQARPQHLTRRTGYTEYRQLSTDKSGLSAKVNENVLVKEVRASACGSSAGRLGSAPARFGAQP